MYSPSCKEDLLLMNQCDVLFSMVFHCFLSHRDERDNVKVGFAISFSQVGSYKYSSIQKLSEHHQMIHDLPSKAMKNNIKNMRVTCIMVSLPLHVKAYLLKVSLWSFAVARICILHSFQESIKILDRSGLVQRRYRPALLVVSGLRCEQGIRLDMCLIS